MRPGVSSSARQSPGVPAAIPRGGTSAQALRAAANRLKALRVSDVRGVARLGDDATLGITDRVEAMHHTIASRAGIVGAPPAGRTAGITGFVYGAVRGTTRLIGRGADVALSVVDRASANAAATPRREAALAVVNGLWGDHLAASGNPLAIPTTLRRAGRALNLEPAALAASSPMAGGRLLVLVHGLCMNDLQWARTGTRDTR